MRYSELFLKTRSKIKAGDSVNAQLLMRGGFIDQVMAGVYMFLPLGLRTLNKIEQIVREEMNTIGTELLMPALSPQDLWKQTNRLETIDVLFEARGANKLSLTRNPGAAVLNSTHEEVITPAATKIKMSYKDLPFGVYQIQTKFRNEERPKSGLLRGREFRMKDLYSFHATKEDLQEYYEEAKKVYIRIFERLGLGEDTVIARASGGDFTEDFSHEFQTFCETGEDIVYIDKESGIAYNKEIIEEGVDESKYEIKKASEVGNIFPLYTKFSEAFDYYYADEAGRKQLVLMASYGIGTSRVMGVLVEKFHDERGIIWPEQVAPFMVYLAGLQMNDSDVKSQVEKVYGLLKKKGIEVMFDDRAEVSAGEKMADADLLGIPWRVIVSRKTSGEVEVKRRSESEAKVMPVKDFLREIE